MIVTFSCNSIRPATDYSSLDHLHRQSIRLHPLNPPAESQYHEAPLHWGMRTECNPSMPHVLIHDTRSSAMKTNQPSNSAQSEISPHTPASPARASASSCRSSRGQLPNAPAPARDRMSKSSRTLSTHTHDPRASRAS